MSALSTFSKKWLTALLNNTVLGNIEVQDGENHFDLVLDHTPSTSTWAIDRKSPQDFLEATFFSASDTTWVTLAFKVGFFTEPPSVQVTGDNTVAGGNFPSVSTNITTSGCTVYFASALGSKLNVQINRTNGDYKLPKKIKDLI